MRFCLTLELKKKVLPIEYRKIILSYIKNALTKCNDGKYYEKFFKDTNQKDYCFSVILPKSRFTKDIISLDGNEVKIIFSVNDKDKTGFILYSAFIAQKNKEYPLPDDNFMMLKSISNKKGEEIVSNRVIFKTTLGSGLCVRNHDKETNKDKYYVYNDEEFRSNFSVVLTNQLLRAGFSKAESEELKVNPIQCEKVVIKHYGRYIDTTIGIFEMRGNNKILQYLYNSGIGSRKSFGFGMVDLVTQDLV